MVNRGAETDNEKTARLRELFVTTTGTVTVTEHQEESRGTIRSQRTVDEALAEIICEMQARYNLQTSLDEDDLIQLVRLYYDGQSDTAIARVLGDESRDKTVTRARIKLHLFRDADFEAPFEIDRLRELVAADRSAAEIAAELSVSESTVRSYMTVINAERKAAATEFSYQKQFAKVLKADDESLEPLSLTLHDGLADAIGGADSHGQ